MVYKVIRAEIRSDGEVVEGKRATLKVWPHPLKVGGLYFLGHETQRKKLYRVVGEVSR